MHTETDNFNARVNELSANGALAAKKDNLTPCRGKNQRSLYGNCTSTTFDVTKIADDNDGHVLLMQNHWTINPSRYSPSSSPQSGMRKPTDSSLDRSSAEWTGRGAMGPAALA